MRRSVAITFAACAAIATGCGRLGFEARGDAGDGGIGADGDDGGGDGMPVPPSGYFVEVAVINAALGGIAGADALCLDRLTREAWRGRTEALAAGRLDAAHVHAWLCTSESCRDLVPGAPYAYASTQNATRGGTRFIATIKGFLEDDGRAFGEPDLFGSDSGFEEYFTGRDGETNGPQADTCGDWTTSANDTLVGVSDTSDYTERIAKYPGLCDLDRAIICIVDP